MSLPGVQTLALLLLVSASPAVVAQDQPLREVIDAAVQVAWQREQLTPAALSSDAEFLRRVYLDVVGTIPTAEEASTFLADKAPEKRAALIDRLLADPRHAQHQADLWDGLLFGRHPPGYDTDRREGFQAWLRQQFAENLPYDELARRILRAEGNSVDEGTPLFYAQYRNQPEDASEAISQIFLGVQLQCARCHNHPFESWTQLDFYGMAAFLSRVNVVSVGKKNNLNMFAVAEKSTGDILFTGPAKEQQPGKKGEPVGPKFLLGEALSEPPLPEGFKEVKFEDGKPPPAPVFSRKNQLADWITRADNPWFARAITNRVWAQYLGRGLVHPVDNLSPANPPSHPELLDALTKWLVANRFDLRGLTRELLNSRTYQLSSAGPTSDPLPRWFEQARVRPLSAEELTDAWRVATGYLTVEQLSGKPPKESRYRPLEGGYVLQFFGSPVNGTGDFQGGLQEHLYLNNGQLGSLISSGKGSLLDSLSAGSMTWDERVDRLYLAILSRPPTDAERTQLVSLLDRDAPPQERLRDAIWALMTCSEFRFNH